MTTFPIGASIGGGRFTITEHLAGDPMRGQYCGRDTKIGASVVVTLSLTQISDRGDQLEFELPRVAKLVHVGPIDGRAKHHVLVEEELCGTRSTQMVRPPLEPSRRSGSCSRWRGSPPPRNRHSVTLAGVRPELVYVWGTLPQVIGVAPRWRSRSVLPAP